VLIARLQSMSLVIDSDSTFAAVIRDPRRDQEAVLIARVTTINCSRLVSSAVDTVSVMGDTGWVELVVLISKTVMRFPLMMMALLRSCCGNASTRGGTFPTALGMLKG
jgi:hypothetical protein